MPKFLSYLLTLLAGVLVCGGLLAAKSPAAARQYDYVTLEKTGNHLYISEGETKYEERKIKEELQDAQHHFGPLHKVIATYEAQGYEVYSVTDAGYSSSGGTLIGHFVTLRRPK